MVITPRPLWCRTQASLLGPAVAQAVEALLGQHALHYLRQSQGIIRLAEKYGAERLNAACQLALAHGDPGYKTIHNILHKALEGQQPLPLGTSSAAAAAAGAYLHGPEQLFAADTQPQKEATNG